MLTLFSARVKGQEGTDEKGSGGVKGHKGSGETEHGWKVLPGRVFGEEGLAFMIWTF